MHTFVRQLRLRSTLFLLASVLLGLYLFSDLIPVKLRFRIHNASPSCGTKLELRIFTPDELVYRYEAEQRCDASGVLNLGPVSLRKGDYGLQLNVVCDEANSQPVHRSQLRLEKDRIIDVEIPSTCR